VKVLIIAGGGVFGIIPARLLADIDGGLRKVGVFGGTSIGGILSMMYASETHPLTVLGSFRQMMSSVFHRSFWSRLVPGPKYSPDALEAALQDTLPDKLSDLRGKVVIPSIDFTGGKPKVWDNISPQDLALEAWMVGRATSAAPTYFPPMDINGHAYIDGGLLENIPIVTTCCAIKDKLGIQFSEMDVFVIGTGHRETGKYTPHEVAGWGYLSWAKPLVEMLTEGNEMGSPFWAKELGLASFRMFDPVRLKHSWNMDNPKDGEKAEEEAVNHVAEFRELFNKWLVGEADE